MKGNQILKEKKCLKLDFHLSENPWILSFL